MNDRFSTLVIPADGAPLARSIAAAFGPGGIGMWTTGLSADGSQPATHYMSSGFIPAEFVNLAPLQTWTIGEDGVWTLTGNESGNAAAVYQAAQMAGIACTLADVEALFSAADATEQEPFTAMARMGLRLVISDMEI